MTKLKVKETIDAGTLNAFAEAVGVPRTTVAYWRDTKRVPAWRLDAFLKAARKLKIDPANPPPTKKGRPQ